MTRKLAERRGRRGEGWAGWWLRLQGWRIVARRVKTPRGEIDLIARRGDLVAFVEVKGRRGDRYGQPVEAVTSRKRQEIESVARWWIVRHADPVVRYRFDVVTVSEDQRGVLALRHIEDAWRP